MNVHNEIKSLCKQIVDNFRPQRVILFGSYAYGNPNDDSDIDLLVIMPFKGRDSQKAIEIRQKIKTSMPLDLLVRTKQQFRKRLEMEDFFMREISEKGKVLYESDHTRMDKKSRRRLGDTVTRVSSTN